MAAPTISHLFSQLDSSIPYSAWSQLGSDIDGEAADDRSGISVSLSADGRTVAIGAINNDDGGGQSGHVRILSYSGSTWSQLGSDINGEAAWDQSGYSVSLSADGRTVAIGAHLNDGNGADSGHVRIYSYNSGTSAWAQLGSDIDGEAGGDLSGYSVSLSADGRTVAIGAPTNDDGPGFNSGHVRIYSYNSGTSAWAQLGSDIDGEGAGDQSGISVSLSADGRTVAIGAHLNDGNGADSGHVRIYQYDSSKVAAVTDQASANFGPIGWNRLGSDIDGEGAGDVSGLSVSLSADGQTVAIGSPLHLDDSGNNAGHVRIYQYDATKDTAVTNQSSANFGPVGWNRLGSDINSEAADDQSGYSVSLSADGRTVAIGARYNDAGNASDDDRGHVRIYSYNSDTSAWSKLGSDIDGEAAGDLSGYSVSLSADGRTVAIGAPTNDAGNASDDDRGHVRIYNIDSTYNTGDTITAGVVFSEPVNITNTPIFNVLTNIDDNIKQFAYVSGDGTNVLYFTKTISAGENIDPLKLLNSTQPTLTGTGTIKDSASNDAVLTLSSDITFHSVIIATAPTISYIFSQLDSTIPYSAWSQLGLNIDGDVADDKFGFSVSLSADGQTLAIGAYAGEGGHGYTHIYTYNSGATPAWQQLGQKIDGEAVGDKSGREVSLSADGRTIAIGEHRNNNDKGQVRIWTYNSGNNTWELLGSAIVGEATNDESGIAVSLSADGRTVAIGAHLNDGNGADSGHVRIYSYNSDTSAWAQLGSDIDGEDNDNRSGRSVYLSADGRIVAIGAWSNGRNDENNNGGYYSGHVRIYQYDATKGAAVTDQSSTTFGPVGWNRLGSDIDGGVGANESGYVVSLSADGRTVAIGAHIMPDGGTTASYANGREKVRIFTYNSTAWSQLGSDIDGEVITNRVGRGRAVYLSADGRTVAIGTPDIDNGHVRIYNINSTYSDDDVITFGVVFSEPVNITNTPIFNVLTNIDDDIKEFTYASGDGTNVLYFNKTIVAGEIIGPLKLLSSTQPILTGTGTIKDSASNDAVLTLSSDITFHSVLINIILNALACFPKGTPINTDHGIIEIQDIIPSRHTIRGNHVRAIIKTQWTRGNMILFKKDCLYNNVPSNDTLISIKHQIYYNGKMHDADSFVSLNKAEAIPHTNNKSIYNVLLDKHDKMITNNMIVETQNPNSMIGYLYNNFLLNDQISKQSINIAIKFTNEFYESKWSTYFLEQLKKCKDEDLLLILKNAFIEYQVKQIGKSKKKVKRIMNKLLPT